MASNSTKRSRARILTMQALYQQQIAPITMEQLVMQFTNDNDSNRYDQNYFTFLVTEAVANYSHYSEVIATHLPNDFRLQSITVLVRAILLVATVELSQSIDVPYKVAIDQAIILAKRFGPEDSYKIVNAILHSIAQNTRQQELAL